MPGSIKSQFKNYFSITKSQWNGMVVLVLLIAVALAAPHLYAWQHRDEVIDNKQYQQAIAQLNAVKPGYDNEDADYELPHTSSMFHFNPNHLSAAQWAKLGLTKHQITTIQHYEAKGGSFKTRQDIKKMYALSATDYARLEPYIQLPDSAAGAGAPPLMVIDLNEADSLQLVKVRGIGPAFAIRILHYRERLGGFHRKDQLKEVFGIDDGMYKEIKGQFVLQNRHIRKLNINTVTFEDLKNNPYLNFKQANAIVMYRKEHGNYDSIDELKNIAILDAGILRKLAPYLTVK
jgi:competence protein ComEA